MLPPALLLWKNYGHGTDALVLIIPVLVMASGQLAGGLAWLAISGEDAPDLVATAPVIATSIIRAKVEAVLRAIMVVVAPFVVALRWSRSDTRWFCRRRGTVCDLGDNDPAMVPRAGAAGPISSSPDLFADRYIRRGVFVDRLGGDGCPLRRRLYRIQRRCWDPDLADAGGNLFRRAKGGSLGSTQIAARLGSADRLQARHQSTNHATGWDKRKIVGRD